MIVDLKDYRLKAARNTNPDVENGLQLLIDLACDEAFAQYDKNGAIKSYVVVIQPDQPRKKSRLNPIRGFVELRGVFEKMSTKINAADADVGFAIATTFFQGHELVFLCARFGDQNAFCTLGVERESGLAAADFTLLGEWERIGFKSVQLNKPSNWRGKRAILSLIKISDAECAAPAFGA